MLSKSEQAVHAFKRSIVQEERISINPLSSIHDIEYLYLADSNCYGIITYAIEFIDQKQDPLLKNFICNLLRMNYTEDADYENEFYYTFHVYMLCLLQIEYDDLFNFLVRGGRGFCILTLVDNDEDLIYSRTKKTWYKLDQHISCLHDYFRGEFQKMMSLLVTFITQWLRYPIRDEKLISDTKYLEFCTDMLQNLISYFSNLELTNSDLEYYQAMMERKSRNNRTDSHTCLIDFEAIESRIFHITAVPERKYTEKSSSPDFQNSVDVSSQENLLEKEVQDHTGLIINSD